MGDPRLALVVKSFSDCVMEYKMHIKGFLQLFMKDRAAFTSLLKDKEEDYVKSFMGSVL